MVAALLLLGLTTWAAATDIVWQKIYNVTTYTGIAAAILLAGVRSWWMAQNTSTETVLNRWSLVELSDSLAGFALCGVLLLACFVLFRIGGGDVKLLAMIGAFLGVEQGLEALLWTVVLGGTLALMMLIWQIGAIELVTTAVKQTWVWLRRGVAPPLAKANREALKTRLYLGPCALLAVVIVHFELLG
ncbi:MAG TPA: A24 family peptidase [Pirellulaceae bacterium]|nr:A24 family peptidase [Pirellulaceae bacterium]